MSSVTCISLCSRRELEKTSDIRSNVTELDEFTGYLTDYRASCLTPGQVQPVLTGNTPRAPLGCSISRIRGQREVAKDITGVASVAYMCMWRGPMSQASKGLVDRLDTTPSMLRSSAC
jgi:hypothetical protein